MKVIITKKPKNSAIEVKGDLLYIAVLGTGWKNKKSIKFEFKKRNSHLNFFAFIIGKGNQTFQLETISDHSAKNTGAHYFIRGALLENSKIDYNGAIMVKKKATNTNAYLASHTLLLSENAKIKTIPSLEIEPEQVKVGHSTTIGEIDKDMLFYMQSRGIDKSTVQAILIKSFLMYDIKKIPNKKVQETINKQLTELC